MLSQLSPIAAPRRALDPSRHAPCSMPFPFPGPAQPSLRRHVDGRPRRHAIGDKARRHTLERSGMMVQSNLPPGCSQAPSPPQSQTTCALTISCNGPPRTLRGARASHTLCSPLALNPPAAAAPVINHQFCLSQDDDAHHHPAPPSPAAAAPSPSRAVLGKAYAAWPSPSWDALSSSTLFVKPPLAFHFPFPRESSFSLKRLAGDPPARHPSRWPVQ